MPNWAGIGNLFRSAARTGMGLARANPRATSLAISGLAGGMVGTMVGDGPGAFFGGALAGMGGRVGMGFARNAMVRRGITPTSLAMRGMNRLNSMASRGGPLAKAQPYLNKGMGFLGTARGSLMTNRVGWAGMSTLGVGAAGYIGGSVLSSNRSR